MAVFLISFLIYQLYYSCCLVGLPFQLVQGVPLPSPQFRDDGLAWNVKYKWNPDPYLDTRRNTMIMQHQMIFENLEKTEGAPGHDLTNDERNRNVQGGYSQFRYIPRKNHRQVRIFDFSATAGQEREELIRSFTKQIQEKEPIYEDKDKVQELETMLLGKGIWAVCKWAIPLPHPLDKDEQCTQSELEMLLQR